MWVFVKQGFYSAVAYDPTHRPIEAKEVGVIERGHHVLVRGRVEDDIAYLCRAVGSELLLDMTADYMFRTIIPTEAWAKFLTDEASDIDYTNFKSTIKGIARHSAYMSVWSAMHRLGQS